MKDLTEYVIRQHRRRRLLWRLAPLIGGGLVGGTAVLFLSLLGA